MVKTTWDARGLTYLEFGDDLESNPGPVAPAAAPTPCLNLESAAGLGDAPF